MIYFIWSRFNNLYGVILFKKKKINNVTIYDNIYLIKFVNFNLNYEMTCDPILAFGSILLFLEGPLKLMCFFTTKKEPLRVDLIPTFLLHAMVHETLLAKLIDP